MLKLQKINQKSAEKAETGSITTFNSKYSNKRNSYNGHQYVAMSPDGTQIVTLNTANYQLTLCKFDNLTKLHVISYDGFRRIGTPMAKLNWSLSISNKFTLADGTVDSLIAVSCFNDDYMKYKYRFNDEEVDINMYDIKASTWIISVAKQLRISSSINNMGGIIKFLDNKDDESTKVVLIDAHGITKLIINHEKIIDIDENWFNIFFSDESIEEFHFPTKFFNEMKRLSDDEIYSFLIRQILVKDRFVVENYRNKVQTIEMYNLKTNLLENTFQKWEESVTTVIGKGSPCFAISNNESLFAYCRGANSITIYLMENGLEVTTKEFTEKNVQILFFDFVQDDNKLLIVIKEKYNDDNATDDFTSAIVVWELFNCSDTCVRMINNTFSLFPAEHQRLASSSGNLVTVTEGGNIISILKEQEIIKLLNLDKSDNIRSVIPLNNISDSSSSTTATTTDYHLAYDFSGRRLDSENNKGFIVKNSEPWVHSKYYKRVSAYLDDNKSIQLIIGESTVQVWRERKGISSTKIILEYIWANNCTEKNRKMEIRSLEIGLKEFSLTLYIPSGNSPSPQLGEEIKLEWPDRVNTPVDACHALEFLKKKRNEPSDLKKQNQFEDLIQQTERIIKKFIINKYGLWRMLDVRFDMMTSLIRGNCVSIIKNILYFKSNEGKNKYLHIPRCYSWDGKIKETDLEIAIKCMEGYLEDTIEREDTIIIKYLLDYYPNNAIKTSNWMFTVAKAIPLLYERQLRFYVKELFQKQCFGANEVYLDICNKGMKDIIKNSHKNIHALNLSIGLVKRKEHGFLQKLIHPNTIGTKSITSLSKVCIVPLPDFTVYPEGIDDKQEGCWKIFLKTLKILFWPRGHIHL